MTTPKPNPDVEYTREVRFAVVMYGGVSLAIYINGVAQELLRMVRATAADDDGKKARLAWDELSGSEKVYRKLSHLLAARDADADSADADADSAIETEPIPTRFVVDTITGASAGGINGIFLAKALVRDQKIDRLEELWVREGAIEKLLNDRLSKDPPAVSYDNPPTALLNAKRMYFELLKAFDEMDGITPGNLNGKPSRPLVDELDLFVTTTDLHGAVLPMRLNDEIVFERRHKNVFHFVYPRDDYAPADADFIPQTNPFLAYAARCTSSFPFAFEPMTLTDIDPILDSYDNYKDKEELRADSKLWKRFFRDYEQAAGIKHVPPARRAFADGGDLDNKPFGYAIDTLTRRHANNPVARKLLYVEPAPDHPELDSEKDEKPNVVENALDALSTLPMYETIREDLKRVSDRNRLVVRVNRVLENVDVDVKKARVSGGTENVQAAIDDNHKELAKLQDDDWSKLYLDDLIKRKGRGYAAYQRLEIAAVTDDLARLVTRGAGLSEESDYFAVNRSLARAWRGLRYVDHRRDTQTESGATPTEPPYPINQFLTEFNLAYPIRRISFLRSRIEFLLCLDKDKLKETYEWHEDFQLTADRVSEFRNELRRIYRSLKDPEMEIRKAARRLSSRPKSDDGASSPNDRQDIKNLTKLLIDACVKELRATGQGNLVVLQENGEPDPNVVLSYFLRGTKHTVCDSPEAESDRRAEALLSHHTILHTRITEVLEGIASGVKAARETADQECRTILGFTEGTVNTGDNPRLMARACLQNYYQNYDDYDMIIFPIVYETEVGEPALVDVFRVSPEDANALIDERATKCRKLAGTALAHFGAFLDERWRKNDILWGRLDGAERIIGSVLPVDHPQRAELIGEAQAAIVYETIKGMGVKESKDLLCESLMRTNSGNAEPNLLTTAAAGQNPGFIDKLKVHTDKLKASLDVPSQKDLNAKINKNLLRQHYLDVFPTHSHPDPQHTLETAARATTIAGKIFEKLADDYFDAGKKFAAWVTRGGLVFWGLVELSTPKSIWNLLFRYWLKVLYLIELIMILGGTLLVRQSVQQFGFLLFGLTVAIHLAVNLLNDFMRRRHRWLAALRPIAILIVLILIVIGIGSAAGLIGQQWLWARMTQAHDWFGRFSILRNWSPAILVGIFFLVSIRKDFRRAPPKQSLDSKNTKTGENSSAE